MPCNCKYVLATAAVALTLGDATPTLAQTAADGIMLEEIVVTARRRNETLQEVPVAVSAFSAETLERAGVKETKNLFSLTPGLYFSQSGQRQNDEQFFLTLRGVGSSPVVEPSVAVFVDGVYVPSLGWSSDFLDIERVEVLRGPQGALFGRNTEAGAVNIITRRPGDSLAGKAALEVAEFGTLQGSASVSGPVSDRVGMGVGIFASTTNGYMDNVTRRQNQDNRRKIGGRATIVVDASDDARFTVNADYRSSKGRFDALGDADPSLQYRIVDPGSARRGTFTEAHSLAGERYTTYGDAEQSINVRNYGIGLTSEFKLGDNQLTAITGYRALRAADIFDIDGIATADATNSATTRQYVASQEVRLTGDFNDAVHWIVGGYGYLERLDQRRLSLLNSGVGGAAIVPGSVSDNARIDRRGVAGFGQITYQVTDRIELATGARYSYEKVEQSPNLRVDVTVPTPAGSSHINYVNAQAQSADFDGFSPMASARYIWSQDVVTYASVATGFKGGGFTKQVPNTPAQNLPVDNETSVNYELGLKSLFLDDRVQLNAALFYTSLKNQQLNTRIEVAPGVYAPTTKNAGKGHTKGAELEAAVRPVGGLTVRGSASYTKAVFDDYLAVPATATLPAYDRSGQPFPEVPKWLASLSADYRFALGNSGLNLIPSVAWRYVGKKFIGEGNAAIPFIDIPSYDVTDIQLMLEGTDWTASLYAHNLFDHYYAENKLLGQPTLSATSNRAYLKPGAPRQIGLRFTHDF